MVDYVRSIRSNHSTFPRFFSTFDMDKLGKVRRRHWKAFPVVASLPIFGATTGNASAVRRLAKFESDCLSEQRYSAVKLRKFTDVFMGGGGKLAPPPHHTKVFKFRNFEELYMYLR